MPSTQRQHQTTRSQPNLAVQIALPLSGYPFDTSGGASLTSATNPATQKAPRDPEMEYLCAWLRSRLEDGLWLIRQESALTATESDRRQVTRLAHKARALGLPVWPPRQRIQRQEVA